MSYQVLARKWRPAKFQEMVGQEHVLKALVNALDDDRLHHAYLFTGTRGVGKTSIARLFAKSLNCETGVSSTPCGECSACREISEGRFVDLIEVDAASRTKVEDTRELLENVQYAPTHGRYKVYLIDEVHMLSTHSFNALLKTLEEPPPHVKFLLATTDPQKLPVTILSRCLQFNLKNMIPERIVEHLDRVLKAEHISFEEPALWLLARSADGSMRDAMSLTDQAIAFGAGEVVEADVRAMLGTIDQRLVYRLVEALAAHDARELLQAVEDLSRFSPDYNTVLGDLVSLLHRIALAQLVPDAIDNGLGDREQVLALASKLTAEDVQLFYQTALMGRKDLPFVPDAREGLEMTLMRMLAFRPASVPGNGLTQNSVAGEVPSQAEPNPVAATVEPSAIKPSAPVAPSVTVEPEPSTAETLSSAASPQAKPEATSEPVSLRPVAERSEISVSVVDTASEPLPEAPESTQPPEPPQSEYDESYFQSGYEDQSLKKSETEDEPHVDAVTDAGRLSSEQSTPAKVDLPWEDSSPVAAQPGPVSTSVAQQKQPMPETVEIDTESEVKVKDPVTELSQDLNAFTADQWVLLVDHIGLTGMTYSIAANTSLETLAPEWLFHYTAEQQAMISDTHTSRIQEAISHYFNTPVEVKFSQGDYGRETPSQYRARKKSERLVEAVQAIENDPVVKNVLERFSGYIDRASVVPID